MSHIPFDAAIFDLDGTLLDSMYVWKRVDEKFFAAHGMGVPEGYAVAIAGLSYRETAEYTVAHYLPDESPDALIDEWTRLSEYEYDHNVALKPFSLEYLRMLRREGVKLGVATALTPRLYTPCLTRLGLLPLFDVICSTEHTDGRGKQTGEVYLLAAEKLGVAPERCAVFEDVLAGLRGARRVGMKAYCVREAHSAGDPDDMAQASDFIMDTLAEMRTVHDFPARRRCVIFTAYFEGDITRAYVPRADDFILCADAGWQLAARVGLRPDCAIGDFDTADAPEAGCVERHPVLKDDSDTELCVRRAVKAGYDDLLLLGGLGGRLDHTMSNIQTMLRAAREGVRIEMRDEKTRVWVLCNGEIEIPKAPGKLSVFSLDKVSRGVSIEGCQWPLRDAVLYDDRPLGLSNVIVDASAGVRVRDGALLILQTAE